MNAVVIGYRPLKPSITKHVLNESIPKRNITSLMRLGKDKCEELLKQRLPQAKILKKETSLYRILEKGMPKKLRGTGRRYYKLDSSLDDYPYIYVVSRDLKKLEEVLVSIYPIDRFRDSFSFKLEDTLSQEKKNDLKKIIDIYV